MDHYSILDKGLSPQQPETKPSGREAARPALPEVVIAPQPFQFPAEDGGRSLTAMAERDLNAALQLLAERAQYITGASGAAIALRAGAQMICRASAGPSAPGLGTALQINSGLSGESVRTRHLLRCDDAENDPRVNRESCRALGIASVVVMPLVRDGEVNGVFELLSERAYAFEDRDIAALERLAEMIQTAIDHAEAARRAERLAAVDGKNDTKPFGSAVPDSQVASEFRVDDEPILLEMSLRAAGALPAPTLLPLTPESRRQDQAYIEALPLNDHGNVRRCQACGFPVSEGRKLCLDCEARGIPTAAPQFLSHLSAPRQSWLRSHLYLVGALVVAAATVALLVWFR